MEIPGTIPALVEAAGQEYADREAIVDGDVRLTFAQLASRVRDAGAAYIAAGVKPGDPVGLWAPNSIDWVIAALGLLAAGGVLVPINTRFKGDEAAYLLEKTRATALVSAGEFLGTDYVALLRASETELPHLTTHVVLDDKASDGTIAWPDFLAAADTSVALPVSRPDDLSDIIFTSGTTGSSQRRDGDARADAARVRHVVRHRRAAGRATATSSSTRSSTRSATRRGSSRV